jgi:hypothetical protein
MEVWLWVVIAAGAAVAVVVLLTALWILRRVERRNVGAPERRAWFDLRELAPEVRDAFHVEWHATQESFVDDPEGAVLDADRLIRAVMRERGYPVDDFEHRAANLSIDYPALSVAYRDAHDLAVSREHSTDDLRQAIRHYRLLFEELAAVGSDAGGAPSEAHLGSARSEARLRPAALSNGR